MPCRMKLARHARDRERVFVEQHAIARSSALGVTRPYSSSWASSSSVMPGGLRELGAGEDHFALGRAEIVGAVVVAHAASWPTRFGDSAARRVISNSGVDRCARLDAAARRRPRPLPLRRRGDASKPPLAVDLVEPFLDHLQRQEVLALLAQDEAQALDVGRRRTCGSPTACARDR